MTRFRLSPSGPTIAIASTSDDVDNQSDVPESSTLSEALDNLADPPVVTLYDDFIGGASYNISAEVNLQARVGELKWLLASQNGAATLLRTSNGSGSLRGIIGISMLASSTHRTGLFLAALDPERVQSLFWRALLNSDNTFSSARRVGLGLNVNANFGGDGIYFEHSATVSANVRAIANKGGAITTVNTGIACPVDTYQVFELRRVGTRSWEFYVNGAFGAAISGSAIPTVAISPACQANGVINTGTAMAVDTFQMTYRGTKRS